MFIWLFVTSNNAHIPNSSNFSVFSRTGTMQIKLSVPESWNIIPRTKSNPHQIWEKFADRYQLIFLWNMSSIQYGTSI